MANSHATPTVQASKGMVVAAHPLASLAGTEILLRGGNAVDAAVATAFALNVVEPGMSCVGGGGFMLIYDAKTQDVQALDYRERIAQKATPTMYEVVADQKSSEGWTLVKGMPTWWGTSRALFRRSCRFDVRFGEARHSPRRRHPRPSHTVCGRGLPVYEALANHMKANAEKLNKFPASRQIYLKNGEPYPVGEMLYQRELGWTLRQIARHGAKGFYEGPVAQAIVREMEENGGLISMDDLKLTMETRPRAMKPAQGIYRGYRIVSMPPPSSAVLT